MSGLAGAQHGQPATVAGMGAAATRFAARLLPEEACNGFRALVPTGWTIPLMPGGVAPVVAQCGHATRLAAPMNLEIVADPPFRAEGFFCEGRHGWVGHSEVPPSEMRALPAENCVPIVPGISIWVIEKGELALEEAGTGRTEYGPGTVLLWRGMQPLRGRWGHARFSYIRLNAPRHSQIPEHVAPSGPGAAQRLEHLGLAPFLAAQLQTFAVHAATLTAAELGEVVGGIVQVAEALLKAVASASPAAGHESPDAAKLQAVHRYIEHNMHRIELSVADIARGTSMSRAQLYRLFETQETSVRGTLRERRLQKSMAHLAQGEGERLSIGAISHACGFSDPAVFSKLFRQRFNATPRDVRAAQGPAR